MTDSTTPVKKTKAELEQLVKSNGGKFYQTNTAAPDMICVADRSKLFFLQAKFRSTDRNRNGQGGFVAENGRGGYHSPVLDPGLYSTE